MFERVQRGDSPGHTLCIQLENLNKNLVSFFSQLIIQIQTQRWNVSSWFHSIYTVPYTKNVYIYIYIYTLYLYIKKKIKTKQ